MCDILRKDGSTTTIILSRRLFGQTLNLIKVIMANTLEYQTIPHDGVIEIPQENWDYWNGKKINVVLMETERADKTPGTTLMSGLREVSISGPLDFSENHDFYLNGDKDA
ncbi:MAG: hypothetical protein HN424_05125 [Candidatus Jacksonbacteria bacterium]|jgi:hypothetical protein|nr:hypothetical protein [Candidatus Jacksonbacteria bacterium]